MTDYILEFDEKEHKYKVNSKDYPSVTTILKVIPKPVLFDWGMRTIGEHLVANADEYATRLVETVDNPVASDDFVKEIKEIPSLYRDNAASFGTLVHDSIEKGTLPDDANAKALVQTWLDFVQANNIKILMQEFFIFNERDGYVGKADALINWRGRHVLVDYKTSKGVYAESALQLSAYSQATHYGVNDGSGRVKLVKADKLNYRIDYLAIAHLKDGELNLHWVWNENAGKIYPERPHKTTRLIARGLWRDVLGFYKTVKLINRTAKGGLYHRDNDFIAFMEEKRKERR